MSLAGNLFMVVATIAGFFHLVTGGESGCKVIRKDGWALEDTFVDMDDYVGKPMISLLPKAKVVRALRSAGLISFPGQDDDEDEGGGADDAISRMDRMADDLCRCVDLPCAENVMKEMSSMREPSGKPSKAQMERAMKIAERMADCQKRLMRDNMPQGPQ